MPLTRYSNRDIVINQQEIYDEIFKERGINGVRQYETPELFFPETSELSAMAYDTRTWKVGDRLYKIAYEMYGDSRYWWIVAQFNKKPTDHHFKVGDTYYVPLSLEEALRSFGL
jgi:hypothetical protein